MTTGLAYTKWLKVQSTKQGSRRKQSACAHPKMFLQKLYLQPALLLGSQESIYVKPQWTSAGNWNLKCFGKKTKSIRCVSVCLMESGLANPQRSKFRGAVFLSYALKDLLQSSE